MGRCASRLRPAPNRARPPGSTSAHSSRLALYALYRLALAQKGAIQVHRAACLYSGLQLRPPRGEAGDPADRRLRRGELFARRSWLCCDASALAIASGDARKSLSRSLLFEHSLRGLWRGSCVIRIMSSPSRLRALLGQADGSACCLKFELPQARAARDVRHRRREAFRPSTSSELSPSTSSLYSLSSISSQSAGCILFLPPFLAICFRPREPAPLPSYSRGRPLLRHRRGRQSSLCSFLARCDRKL